MKDRVSTRPGRVLLSPENGSAPFYATMTRADEPTQSGDPLNKNTFLKDETAALFGFDGNATPNDVFAWLGEWGQANWKLIAEYNAAGAYTFTVPDDVDELGVFILGGGSSGEALHHGTGVGGKTAHGGSSGGLTQVILKKSANQFLHGEEISVVVGAGGIGGIVTTNNGQANVQAGGTSAFKAIVSQYGQENDANAIAPYGLDGIRESAFGYGGRNIFDPNDTHIYCGAGGNVSITTNASGVVSSTEIQTVVARAKGSAGAGTYKSGGSVHGGNATAPGDGGGGAIGSSTNISAAANNVTSGNGADGLVLVYGRKIV